MNAAEINVLFGFEESQAGALAFRSKGFNAFSCDIKNCSGGAPQFHLRTDIMEALFLKRWHIVVLHPPCTYLSGSGLHWNKRRSDRAAKTEAAIEYVKKLMSYPFPYVAMENPVGALSTRYKKPTQIIQPYQYGHAESKTTCLWLRNLPKLKPTMIMEAKRFRCRCGNITFAPGVCCNRMMRPLWDNMTPTGQNKLGPGPERAAIRSKTYPGIAEAMADQWGNFVLTQMNNS